MPRLALSWLLMLVCAASIGLRIAGADGLDSPRGPEIRNLIKKLGADDWAVREAARKTLLKIGDEALPYLEEARDDPNPDPERAWRVNELATAIRWAVPSQLRKMVGPEVDDWPSLTRNEKLEVLEAGKRFPPQDFLVAAGFLTKIVRYDDDVGIKRIASDLYMRVTPKARPVTDRVMVGALAKIDSGVWCPLYRSRIHKRLGEPKPALAAIRVARSRDPSDAGIESEFVSLLLLGKHYKEALPILEARTKRSPKSLLARVNLGECLIALDRREDGLAALQKVMAIPGAKTNLDVYKSLTAVYLRHGFKKEALQLCRDGIKRFPFDNTMNVLLARCELANGDVDLAMRRFFSELRYAEPGTEVFKSIRAGLTTILTQRGCASFAADETFWDDIGRGRPIIRIHDRLARWLADRGLDAAAARELTLVVALNPRDVDARLRLALLLMRMGKADAARKRLEEAKALSPQDTEIEAQMAILEKAAGEGNAARVASLAFWETRLARIGSNPKPGKVQRVGGSLDPRPLILADRILLCRPDRAAVTAYERKSGKPIWTRELEGLEPLDGGEVGLEPLALIDGAAALAIRVNPSRALEAGRLIAVVSAGWERKTGESRWNGAAWRELHVSLLEPEDGKVIGRFTIKDALPASAPVLVRHARLWILTRRSESRVSLSLIDLAAGRKLEQESVRGRRFAPLRMVGDRLLVSYSKGDMLFDAVKLKPVQRLKTPADTVQLLAHRGLMARGRDRRLHDIDLDGGDPKPLAEIAIKTTAGLAISPDGRVLIGAARDGRIAAMDPTSGETLWEHLGEKAAERRMWFTDSLVFLANGSRDLFTDEVPYLVGLRLSDGALVWKRPYEPPLRLALDEDLLTVCVGRGAEDGRLLGLSFGQSLSRKIQVTRELQGAARDAFQANEPEIALQLFRLFLGARKSKEPLGFELQVEHARLLAASKRMTLAANLLAELESRSDAKEARRFHKIRLELGLETEELAEESESDPKKRTNEDKSKSGKADKNEGGQGDGTPAAGDGDKAGDKPTDGDKTAPKEPDDKEPDDEDRRPAPDGAE